MPITESKLSKKSARPKIKLAQPKWVRKDDVQPEVVQVLADDRTVQRPRLYQRAGAKEREDVPGTKCRSVEVAVAKLVESDPDVHSSGEEFRPTKGDIRK